MTTTRHSEDERRLVILIAELAADSLKRRETPEQWKARLRELRAVIDSHIQETE